MKKIHFGLYHYSLSLYTYNKMISCDKVFKVKINLLIKSKL